MAKWWVAAVLLIAAVSSSIGDATGEGEVSRGDIRKVLLVSEEWENATHSDGRGLYWDIFRYVYEPVGIEVNIRTLPYDASVQHVQRGRADAWLASYLNEKSFPLYPDNHFDVDIVSVMFDPQRQASFSGVESLKQRRVAWIKGYDYDRYMEIPFSKFELDKRHSVLKMLQRGRIDFFLDARIDMAVSQKKYQRETSNMIVRDLFRLKLYPAFANSARGEKLRVIWDQRLPELRTTDRMKQLFKKWGYFYPF